MSVYLCSRPYNSQIGKCVIAVKVLDSWLDMLDSVEWSGNPFWSSMLICNVTPIFETQSELKVSHNFIQMACQFSKSLAILSNFPPWKLCIKLHVSGMGPLLLHSCYIIFWTVSAGHFSLKRVLQVPNDLKTTQKSGVCSTWNFTHWRLHIWGSLIYYRSPLKLYNVMTFFGTGHTSWLEGWFMISAHAWRAVLWEL